MKNAEYSYVKSQYLSEKTLTLTCNFKATFLSTPNQCS